MEFNINNILAYFTILTTSAVFLNKVVIDPLKASVDKLAAIADDLKKEVQSQRERMALAEASLKSEHKRLDGYEQRLLAVEHKCDTCNCKD